MYFGLSGMSIAIRDPEKGGSYEEDSYQGSGGCGDSGGGGRVCNVLQGQKSVDRCPVVRSGPGHGFASLCNHGRIGIGFLKDSCFDACAGVRRLRAGAGCEMMPLLRFYSKLGLFLLRGNVVKPESITEDYDRLSRGYDDNFSLFVGRYSRELVGRMGLKTGARILDLACGTGTLSLSLAEAAGPDSRITAVDRSSGMLTVARKKAATIGISNVDFVQSDMEAYLGSVSDCSLDAITCGWAIGYVKPGRLLELARMKLKPGGIVGIIENARDTLEPVRRTALKVVQTYPEHFVQAMDLHLRLPKDKEHLRDLFSAARLTPAQSWSGEASFEFKSGAEVLSWVMSTGASAGFDKVMSRASRGSCDAAFIKFIERDFMKAGVIRVAHRYVAGVAGKEA